MSNSLAGRKADHRRTCGLISVVGVTGTVTVRELGMGYQANCLIIDLITSFIIINFNLTIFKSQISVALGFRDNAFFPPHLTWRYCRKVVKIEQTRDTHQVTQENHGSSGQTSIQDMSF